MNSTCQSASTKAKRLSACACLLAVVMLWTPVWAAALQANGMACCDGAMCAVQGHAKASHLATGVRPQQEQQPVGCSHGSASSSPSSSPGSMAGCAMSCCQPHVSTFTASVTFLVAVPSGLSATPEVLSFLGDSGFAAISNSSDILSPPPRNFFL